MNNLKNIKEFITEKRVTVKRRYTERYPAKNVSTAARVRNAILDAVADGHLTEDEVNTILGEIKAHKRWLKRNLGLFNISEDETGIKRYSLSPYGQRVRNATESINEALKVPHKKPGMKKVNMFVGRFQPFTLGHVKVFEKMYKENGLPVVVFLVRGKNPDPEKRPFDETLQQAMFAKMAKQYPFLETAIVVPNGAIDTLFAAARPTYEPVMWGYGTDRKKAYDSMINKDTYREQLGVDPEFSGYEIFRTDDNISASKVRNALKIDDEKTFKKMTPKSIHSFYKTLQDILQPIKENKKMKNLKTLNEFASVNEAKRYTVKDIVSAYKDAFGEDIMKGDRVDVIDDIKSDYRGKITIDELRDIYDDRYGEEIEADFLDALGESVNNEKKVNEAEFMGLPLETFADWYAAADVALSIGVSATVAFAILAKLGIQKGTQLFKKGKKAVDDWYSKNGKNVKESVELNEEYVEVMDPVRMANAMGEIQQVWNDWKNGPMTEPNMIKPAQKELKGWLDRWFKQNIK